jgi:hypothetical protein
MVQTDATAATSGPLLQGMLAGRASAELERSVIAELWEMLAALLSGGVESVVASIQ